MPQKGPTLVSTETSELIRGTLKTVVACTSTIGSIVFSSICFVTDQLIGHGIARRLCSVECGVRLSSKPVFG